MQRHRVKWAPQPEATCHSLTEGEALVCMVSHQPQPLLLGRRGELTLAYSPAEHPVFHLIWGTCEGCCIKTLLDLDSHTSKCLTRPLHCIMPVSVYAVYPGPLDAGHTRQFLRNPSSQGPEIYTNPHSTLLGCSPLSQALNFKIHLS